MNYKKDCIAKMKKFCNKNYIFEIMLIEIVILIVVQNKF